MDGEGVRVGGVSPRGELPAQDAPVPHHDFLGVFRGDLGRGGAHEQIEGIDGRRAHVRHRDLHLHVRTWKRGDRVVVEERLPRGGGGIAARSGLEKNHRTGRSHRSRRRGRNVATPRASRARFLQRARRLRRGQERGMSG